MDKNICIGRVCTVKAGRGKGRYFIICGIVNAEYVLLAVGISRKTAKPKLKKIRHIQCRPYVAAQAAEQILSGRNTVDAMIRNELDRIAAIDKQ